ncbi:hypothetical protein [Gaoshiqia sediminis]|uniref:NACHT domain-containing protein n=1 Tax=Gaoshiqia sediminis TaxID=2986998 RepID=A0AA42CAD3_9BACT|nr:hypothetical protein [Gaoshiqia sediminis]MCW0483350.1 hypothetical protein [Gaoshiqia sediminis]
MEFKDWQEFINHFEKERHRYSPLDNWENLKNRTNEITRKSLESLKHKLGDRFNNFPYRRFAEKRFSAFLSSPQVATAFVAPDGYGKTPIVVQLAERFFTGPDALCPNDILCLVDGSLLYNLVTIHQRVSRLYNLIEYDPRNSFSTGFREHPEQVKGRFVLVIDGIDDVYPINGKTLQFIENLLKVISTYEHIPWFKVLITCTPLIWRMFSERIQKDHLQKLLWYNSTLRGTEHEIINIPLLKRREIDEILAKNHFPQRLDDLEVNNPDLADIIRTPYLLHLFIITGKTKGSIHEIDLLNLYIKRMVLSPPMLYEKYSILKSYFSLCSYGEMGVEVKKNDLHLSPSENIAYIELMRIGLLYEYSLVDEYLTLNTYVSFSHHALFAYYLANILLKENTLTIDYLREKITDYYHSPKLQVTMVEYFVKILFKEEQVEILKDIFTLFEKEMPPKNTYPSDKPCCWGMLAFFVSCEMRKNPGIRELLLPWYAQSEIGCRLYFERFFDLDRIVLNSGDELDCYLRYNKSDSAKRYVHYLKYMQYFLSENHELCQQEYEHVSKSELPKEGTPSDFAHYFVPQLIHQAVCHTDMDGSLMAVAHDTANQLLHSGKQEKTGLPVFEFELISALHYGQRHLEIIQLARQVLENYDLSNWESSVSYQLFLSDYASALLQDGEKQTATDLYKLVKFKHINFPMNMKYFLKIRLQFIKAEFLTANGEPGKARSLLRKIQSVSEKLQFRYFYQKALKMEAELSQPPGSQKHQQV